MIKRLRGNGPNNIRIEALDNDDNPEDEKYGASTYTLFAGKVLFQAVLGNYVSWEEHDLRSVGPYTLQPKEYIKVVPSERIILPHGIVARFDSPSNLIDTGLALIAGKLDPHYGEKEETLYFGLQNITGISCEITKQTRIAHVTCFDMRGIIVEDNLEIVWLKHHIKELLRAKPLIQPGGPK